MVLPVRPPFAWKLGTPEDRNQGGIVGLIWADSVLPYSVNPPTVPVPSEPPPDPPDPAEWWTQPPPVHGQFEGWVRNFLASGGTGAPNFPNSRHLGPEDNRIFNCVIPFIQGLTVSENAPRRVSNVEKELDGTFSLTLNPADGPNVDHPEKVKWPFGATDQLAIQFIEFYLEHFIDPTSTSVIIALPVREVMNYVGQPADPSLQPTPDETNGALAIVEFVWAVMTKCKELGIEIFGWYLIDEPDFLILNYWISAKRVGRLRRLVREAEYAWRIASPDDVPNDPAFLSLGNAPQGELERQARLRPCMLTFSRDFGEKDFLALPGITRREQPSDYAAANAADLYFFDWYPYRRTLEEVTQDWSVCAPGPLPDFKKLPFRTFGKAYRLRPDDPEDFTLVEPMTPKQSLRRFRYMRRSLNAATGGSTLPNDLNYIPVMLWSQADGSIGNQWHESEDAVSPDLSPAIMPRPNQSDPDFKGEGCFDPESPKPLEPFFRRLKLMPTPNKVQYYMWAGLKEWGEGFACFGQTLISDQAIVDRFVPAARELLYFQSWRWNSIDTTDRFVPDRSRIRQDALPGWDQTPKIPYDFQFFRLRQPAGSLAGLQPEELLDWLLVINRENSALHVDFTFERTGSGLPAGPHVLQSWRFLEPQTEPDTIIPINESGPTEVSFTLPPQTMILARLGPPIP